MKRKIIILVLLLFIVLGCILYIYSIKNMRLVKLNEEIILKKFECVKLKNKDVYLTIEGFTNSPPPEGAVAFWSGLAVGYKIEINGKTYTTNTFGSIDRDENLPYIVEILDSDYKTFAKVRIVKNENLEK